MDRASSWALWQQLRENLFSLQIWKEIILILKPEFKQPPTQPSLFNYLKVSGEATSARQVDDAFLESVLANARKRNLGAHVTLSPFSDFDELKHEVDSWRRRRRIAIAISMILHISIIMYLFHLF